MSGRALRVLHCPTSTGGNPQGLAAAERRLGLDSRSLVFQQNRFLYQVDEVLWSPSDGLVQRERKRWALLLRILRGVDLIHFNFGQSIMPRISFRKATGGLVDRLRLRLSNAYASLFQFRDLPLLRLAGKGIVVTYQGDDARQGDYCKENFSISMTDEQGDDWYSPAMDNYRRYAIRMMDRYADRIYSLNPDLMHVLPARTQFMAYANVDPDLWQPPPGFSGNARPVVLHAPSSRGAKGTRFIMEAVERLKAEGVDFEFVLVENLSHAEARRQYDRADLLVDQLLAGWYGGLSVELMAMGKPVICYLRPGDLQFVPRAMREALPIIQADPGSIYSVLRTWLTERRAELQAMGARSRQFAVEYHNPVRIAATLREEYLKIMAGKARR